jgi:hypothetical protein
MVPGPEDPERLHQGDEVMQDPTSPNKLIFSSSSSMCSRSFCCRGQGSRHVENEGSSDL